MIGSRVALVADDQRLATSIQTALKKALGQPAFHCKFDALRSHIGRDTDGVLVLVPTTAAEAEPLLRLLQEVSIQKLNLSIIILTTDDFPPCPEIDQVEPQAAKRLSWPADAEELGALARAGAASAEPFLGTSDETLEEVIQRR